MNQCDAVSMETYDSSESVQTEYGRNQICDVTNLGAVVGTEHHFFLNMWSVLYDRRMPGRKAPLWETYFIDTDTRRDYQNGFSKAFSQGRRCK